MSRIGKKPILIPEKVEIKIDGGNISVKGSLGELTKSFEPKWVGVSIKEGMVVLVPKKNTKTSLALWGTYSSHISNMVEGVTKGFEKKLVISGVGFKAQVEGKDLILSLGLSHPVKMEVPEGLKVEVDKNIISVSGSNKEMVGQFSANIRAKKKPEPYKGKGIKYENEIIRRKAGKKAVAGS